MKICFRCKKPIEEKSNYYKFTEIDNEKEIDVNYTHKECWNEFLKQISNTDEAMVIIRGLKNKLIDLDFLPKEEYIIK